MDHETAIAQLRDAREVIAALKREIASLSGRLSGVQLSERTAVERERKLEARIAELAATLERAQQRAHTAEARQRELARQLAEVNG